MSQSTITKVKNGKITLPKSIQKSWKDAEVYVSVSEDTAILKKMEVPSFWELRRRLKKVSKSITQKDIDDAVAWARRNAPRGK